MMDSGTRKEIHDIVDAVIATRMQELRELQIDDFADVITVLLSKLADIFNARTSGLAKEILEKQAAEAKEHALKHRPGFT